MNVIMWVMSVMSVMLISKPNLFVVLSVKHFMIDLIQ